MVMEIRLTKREVEAIAMALRNAEVCSDLADNGKFYGRAWVRREKRFLARCRALERRLTEALAKK
jgi:hypothetical protein